MTTIGANEASNQAADAAIELSKKTWVLGIATSPERDRPSIHRIAGGNLRELIVRVRAAGEDGATDFWSATRLAMTGSGSPGRSQRRISNAVSSTRPASRSIAVRVGLRPTRIDVLALLRALIAIDRGERHVCAVVRVPSIEEEDARRPHRERQRLVRERTGHINRIKGLLFAQGIGGIEPKRRLTRIDFSALTTAEGQPLPDCLRRELEREYARLEQIQNQIGKSRKNVTPPTRKSRPSRGNGRC